MITKKMQIKVLQDQVGELQRRTSKLEEELDSFKYEARCELKHFLKCYLKEEVGYVVVKRDREQIIAQIKDVISNVLKTQIK